MFTHSAYMRTTVYMCLLSLRLHSPAFYPTVYKSSAGEWSLGTRQVFTHSVYNMCLLTVLTTVLVCMCLLTVRTRKHRVAYLSDYKLRCKSDSDTASLPHPSRFLYQVFPGTTWQCQRLLRRAARTGELGTVRKLVRSLANCPSDCQIPVV